MDGLRKRLFILSFCVFGVVGGCLEASLTDISGWDLSACVDGFDTCYDLFFDNEEKILGGETLIEVILGGL